MTKRSPSPSHPSSPPPSKSIKPDPSASPSGSKAKPKIPADKRAKILEMVFDQWKLHADYQAIATETGLSVQQIKSQLAGGGRANLRNQVVDAAAAGKF